MSEWGGRPPPSHSLPLSSTPSPTLHTHHRPLHTHCPNTTRLSPRLPRSTRLPLPVTLPRASLDRPQAGAQLMPTASLNGPHISSAPNGESATSSASHAAIANCAQPSAAIAHGAPPSAPSPPANGISPSPPTPPSASRPKSGRLQRGLVSPHPSPPAKPGSAGSPSPRVPERTEQFGLAGRTVGRPATAGASPACSPTRK